MVRITKNDLTRRVNEAMAEGERDWQARKGKNKPWQEIWSAPETQVMENWCCGVNFRGVKVTNQFGVTRNDSYIREEWEDKPRAEYQGKCPKCHLKCSRRLTGIEMDEYYKRSKKVRRMRARHRLDTLQPYEEGYKLNYGSLADQILSEKYKEQQSVEDFL